MTGTVHLRHHQAKLMVKENGKSNGLCVAKWIIVLKVSVFNFAVDKSALFALQSN